MRKSVAGLLCLLLSACQHTADITLYQQLGAEKGVAALVDKFIDQIGNDKLIFNFFADADVSHFRQGFITHLCDIADGPCRYQGDTMVDIHTGMHIKESDFNHVVDLLVVAMNEQGIDVRVQNQLLARLAPLREEIIYR